MTDGLFITFEGVDGCGKSTQARMLAERLERERSEALVEDPLLSAGLAAGEVLLVREPGGTDAAERIREILIDAEVGLGRTSELLLFAAARADLTEKVLLPALRAGGTVVCDRFTDSTDAYQGRARGLGSEPVAQLNRLATDGLTPDVTFYLSIDPGIARERLSGGDRFENEGLDFAEAVARAYDKIAAENPDRVVTIDALGTPDEVQERILEQLERVRQRRPDHQGAP